ncbi:MAG: GNAT family N-acetyltransferase [Planctomycetes bacterium]|nr:GNAT family N-acetyltransferase [Planctomycetota bacterium]
MEHVRRGGDGPLVPAASVVAAGEKGEVRAALLVVLKPPGYRDDPWRWDSWRNTSAPDPAVDAGKAQAHLDWVFVSPWYAGNGVASSLLARSAIALRDFGHASLTSSFMLGNGESMAWHWRNGFELLPNPASMRNFQRRLREAGAHP